MGLSSISVAADESESDTCLNLRRECSFVFCSIDLPRWRRAAQRPSQEFRTFPGFRAFTGETGTVCGPFSGVEVLSDQIQPDPRRKGVGSPQLPPVS